MGSVYIIRNAHTKVAGPIPAELWEKLRNRREIKRAFEVVDYIPEPPEVAELKRINKK